MSEDKLEEKVDGKKLLASGTGTGSQPSTLPPPPPKKGPEYFRNPDGGPLTTTKPQEEEPDSK